eukprot:3050890-Rhodomonas_salina.1
MRHASRTPRTAACLRSALTSSSIAPARSSAEDSSGAPFASAKTFLAPSSCSSASSAQRRMPCAMSSAPPACVIAPLQPVRAITLSTAKQ